MRKISAHRGASKYGMQETKALRELQIILNELGCDVGTVDGMLGQKTEGAALECVDFGLFLAPRAVTAGNVYTWLELYSEHVAQSQ